MEYNSRMNPKLELYLRLESVMLQCDKHGDARAESIRELMDSVWHELTDADHEFLDQRALTGVNELEFMHVHLLEALYSPPRETPQVRDVAAFSLPWQSVPCLS